jgi:hypothetical protein
VIRLVCIAGGAACTPIASSLQSIMSLASQLLQPVCCLNVTALQATADKVGHEQAQHVLSITIAIPHKLCQSILIADKH